MQSTDSQGHTHATLDRPIRRDLALRAAVRCYARVCGVRPSGDRQSRSRRRRRGGDPLLVDGVFIIATEVPIPGRLHLRSTHEEAVEGASVRLPSPRLVSKIVVHATDLVEFDVIVEGPGSGGWQLLTTVRKTGARSTVAPVPGVRRLAAVRIRPRKARDDRWNVEISEIELFGPATDPTP